MAKEIITKAIKYKRLYFDGGTGTVLQSMGLCSGQAPEEWNLSHPERITALHKSYVDAGCNIIKTNTFGVNCSKYSNYKELAASAVACAKAAIAGLDDRYVAYDIGPTGRLMKPMGDLDFEEAVEIFSHSAILAKELGCDLILIETMNDSLETKAALLAAKEACDLPVFVTNAYGADNKLMTGADPTVMIAMLEGMGADAIGLNCSCGPDKMMDIVDTFAQNASVPIIVNPNAGLPVVINGKTVFNIRPDRFADYMVTLAQKGGCILGGCCGTTPDHMAKMIEKTRDLPYSPPAEKQMTVVTSYTHRVEIGSTPVLIGERLNPTGKPKLKEALKSHDINYILSEALAQVEAGAHMLDVNVGMPEINEPEMLPEVVRAIQGVTDIPLQLDSSNPQALANAARVYNGKPLINSVNGKRESMEAVFPIVKKYSGAVIALTMDENGIPQSAPARLAIAERIASVAAEYGIAKKDIIVDPLALTISSDTQNAVITLESIRLLHQNGFKTSLGVSNISFGLPERDNINSVFYSNALMCGLDCAIMNPFSSAMMNVYYAFRALNGMDKACGDYIAHATPALATQSATVTRDLQYCIEKGLTADAVNEAKTLAKTLSPLEVIDLHVIPALNKAGTAFEEKKTFLPQLLMSAEAATAVFDELKSLIPQENKKADKKFVIATVKGDIHDIGKNIVKVMLESYGFDVIDLGKDVPADAICQAASQSGCLVVGLSALMTTTVPAMEETIKQLRITCPNVKVVVGGAVLTKEYADAIGADFYAADAMETVRIAQMLYGGKD